MPGLVVLLVALLSAPHLLLAYEKECVVDAFYGTGPVTDDASSALLRSPMHRMIMQAVFSDWLKRYKVTLSSNEEYFAKLLVPRLSRTSPSSPNTSAEVRGERPLHRRGKRARAELQAGPQHVVGPVPGRVAPARQARHGIPPSLLARVRLLTCGRAGGEASQH